VKQIEADPAWRDYEHWIQKRPDKPAERTPIKIGEWLQTQLDALAQWKQFEAEGGIKEFNRLGGSLDPDDRMNLDKMLDQLRWAKGQEKALQTTIATDDQLNQRA
jgi:hypothetical protein